MESNKKRLIRIALGAVLFTAAVLVNTNSSIIKAVLFLAPFIIIGGVLGIILVKKLPEKGFRYFTTAVTCLSVLMLLI